MQMQSLFTWKDSLCHKIGLLSDLAKDNTWSFVALVGGIILLTYPLNSARAIEGYYKDLFMDGGINLTHRTSLPAADYLGLSMEYLATSDQLLQNDILLGNSNDYNGVLLYPDGQPRFRCIYMNGGSAVGGASTQHGISLGESGRERIRNFYYNGGCYTGTCAGAFIVSNGNNYIAEKPEYLHIWPAKTHSTGLSSAYTGHFIPLNSPLLKYYDFGGDFYIDNVYHLAGVYVDEVDSSYWVANSEILLRYDYPEWLMHNKVSSWAYKNDVYSGRLTVIGSHPEGITSGERRDLMAALLQYALDGAGQPHVKAALQNNVTRFMNNNNLLGHEKIGDKQYHHYSVELPTGRTQLKVSVNGGDDLSLFLKKGDFAFKDSIGVIEAANTSSFNESIIINNPPDGIWYIGVKGVNTISETQYLNFCAYDGNLEVLNGIPYTISAEWDAPIGDLYVDGRIDLFDLHVLLSNWLQNNMVQEGDLKHKIAHWRLDEGEGEYVYDSMNTNKGKIVGANWSEDIERGKCLSFDGEDDYVELTEPLLIFSGSFTISMWVKVPAETSGRGGTLLGDLQLPDSVGINFEIDGGQLRFYWNGAPNLCGSIDLRDGTWHLITFIRDEKNHKIYGYVDRFIDIDYSGAIADKTAITTHRIGCDNRTGDAAFHGFIDDIRMYDYALSSSEISRLYEGLPIFTPSEDFTCSGTPIGDLNEDCIVDIHDFCLLAETWLLGVK
ncbi:MAG: pre-peptidase C-terminal domain-containing protein [Sedimentisphaerales bacterium]|nr:pre-peptidase C-terminal domain-containing protein [Sedimentisphaerales bacterium]